MLGVLRLMVRMDVQVAPKRARTRGRQHDDAASSAALAPPAAAACLTSGPRLRRFMPQCVRRAQMLGP